MNLQTFFETQKILDQRIVEQHGLEGQDLLSEKILALQVELGECANEWRGFKFWSKDQEPRGERECQNCGGECHRLVFVGTPNEHEENCEECGGEGVTNNLLEEYVDGIHFFLSIANEKGWESNMYLQEDAIEDIRVEGLQGGITGAFIEVNHLLSHVAHVSVEKEKHFRYAWTVFLAIGLVGFNFTLDQIEASYYAKNKINHSRQATGY